MKITSYQRSKKFKCHFKPLDLQIKANDDEPLNFEINFHSKPTQLNVRQPVLEPYVPLLLL